MSLTHAILLRALDQAVKWWLIPHNPANAVDAPRPNPPEMQTWTAEHARAFLAATSEDGLAALWVLAHHTGMRRGEILGLRWRDVDLERGTLAVRRMLSRGPEGMTFGEPKTTAGRRSIALSAPCVAALRSYGTAWAARRMQPGPAWCSIVGTGHCSTPTSRARHSGAGSHGWDCPVSDSTTSGTAPQR